MGYLFSSTCAKYAVWPGGEVVCPFHLRVVAIGIRNAGTTTFYGHWNVVKCCERCHGSGKVSIKINEKTLTRVWTEIYCFQIGSDYGAI